MKKENGGGSKNSKPTLQFGGDDASRLVGGIVEKGFSDNPQGGRPIAPPRPSVLPFPVARHRSHGPHWAPKIGGSNVVNDNDYAGNDNREEEDFDGMEVAANIANPVQRKERKGVDFSRWKEIVKNNGTKKEPVRETKEINSDNLSRRVAVPDENVIEKRQWPQNHSPKSEGSNVVEKLPTWRDGSSKDGQVDLKMKSMQKSKVASGFAAQKFVGGEEVGIESQIDAENRAQLSKMSADEIAEAQAEIMNKLNPELINLLKKRGQTKVKRQKFSLSDVTGSEADSLQSEKNRSKLIENTMSDKPLKIVTTDTLQDKDDKASSNISEENCSMWDAWSKRVESVRDMRFSVEGKIIRSDFARVSDDGKPSSESGYSADNVSERDFLRTEGDPGASGYTIKEAVALSRSVIPGQRTIALHLIAAVLDKAICSISQNQVDSEGPVDWEAVWAFALGPEPELALSLRMSLDDNHNSVVLACVKVIQCVLSCTMNEIVFDMLEKTPTYVGGACTAPVFRTKPDVNVGFIRGGFWKYNVKPSNILHFHEEESEGDKDEGEHTIKDDVVLAGQDFAAGLVRMGILPRICFLLETDPSAPLEECLISILIAIARHSPTCAAAIIDSGKIVQTVASRFASKEQMEINICKIKSVTLLKVLAQYEKKNCLSFINSGILHKVTWHLYRYPNSLDQWVKSGAEACKLSSALLVEQLRLYKVFIRYGYCISDFSNMFTSLCMWLSVPTIEKLMENDVMNEYCAITKEVYLILEVLACRLPNFYSDVREKTKDVAEEKETWSWSQFGSIFDLALEWVQVKNIAPLTRLFNCQNNVGEIRSLQDSEINSLLWVISSVLNMLSSVLKAVIPEDFTSLPNGRLSWLPEFVPKVGLEIIKNGYFRFSENGSIVDYLCRLRIENGRELAISSTCCIQGLVRVVDSVDKLIQHANLEIHQKPSKFESAPEEDKILANGILKSCAVEVQYSLTNLMKQIMNKWQSTKPVEIFSRGGPAPGVGVGWGASDGGYWSLNTLLTQQEARLLVDLLEISEIPPTAQTLNCALTACLTVGPGNSSVIDKLLNFMFRVPVLKYLNLGIGKFLSVKQGFSPFKWDYEENEYLLFANALATHFRNRWLTVKKKQKSTGEKINHKSKKKDARFLETIDENMDESNQESLSSLKLEWAYQRLPLPTHWFLSAISTVNFVKIDSTGETYMEMPENFLEVSKAGLFLLLGIEAIPASLTSEFFSPVECVTVVWKLHAISVVLLSGMGVLEDEKSRDVYETLQNIYGKIIDEKELHKSLQFESEIHKNYPTFIETLVEQFAAESYGDVLFGRQIAMYLHRSVEASVRLAAWNGLSNARALELLPTLDKCFSKAEGYLEPIEDDEKILEAYVKSWVGGALDRAAKRNSMSFSLVLHHLSWFIFGDVVGDMLSLRNKLVKSLLRDYSRKQQQHEGMLVKLVCYYNKSDRDYEIERRLQLLKQICDGNLASAEKLESCIKLNHLI
ncbi:hypothetical protein ABFS82_02G004000 [Erythranthe guttata]|uniref:RNA polymerase II-associated protein 1 C-terminal domain-containing protein n=1 Tax=Erythranthe guttata TaxID=4155 RepID=A0A022RE34_ERYGU|nr:PREDICTED: uncharacterized protein LOC105957806 [Erythranthe guttata]EYU37998.1 hypothetical protein MIMGU_mgv1a000182mg [Erythranthe guttata]|eukprot:XP_012837224.1 PREDICTED: uncharacterized protein LOC105957806 [Erythranthe guttata]